MEEPKAKILGLIIGLIKIVILTLLFSVFSDNTLLAIIAASAIVLVLNSEYRS